MATLQSLSSSYYEDDSFHNVMYTVNHMLQLKSESVNSRDVIRREVIKQIEVNPEKICQEIAEWKIFMERCGMYNCKPSSEHTCSPKCSGYTTSRTASSRCYLYNLWDEPTIGKVNDIILYKFLGYNDMIPDISFSLSKVNKLFGCFKSGRLHFCHPLLEYRIHTCNKTLIFNGEGKGVCVYSGLHVPYLDDTFEQPSKMYDKSIKDMTYICNNNTLNISKYNGTSMLSSDNNTKIRSDIPIKSMSRLSIKDTPEKRSEIANSKLVRKASTKRKLDFDHVNKKDMKSNDLTQELGQLHINRSATDMKGVSKLASSQPISIPSRNLVQSNSLSRSTDSSHKIQTREKRPYKRRKINKVDQYSFLKMTKDISLDVLSGPASDNSENKSRRINVQGNNLHMKNLPFMSHGASSTINVSSNDNHINEFTFDDELFLKTITCFDNIGPSICFKYTNVYWVTKIQRKSCELITSLTLSCMLLDWVKFLIADVNVDRFSLSVYTENCSKYWGSMTRILPKIYNMYHSYMSSVPSNVQTRKCTLPAIILGLADILTVGMTVNNQKVIDKIQINDNNVIPFPVDAAQLRITFSEVEETLENTVYTRYGINFKRYLNGVNNYYKEYTSHCEGNVTLTEPELNDILLMYKHSYTEIRNEKNKKGKLFNEMVVNNAGTFDYKTNCSRGSKCIREMCRQCDITMYAMRKLFYSDLENTQILQ